MNIEIQNVTSNDNSKELTVEVQKLVSENQKLAQDAYMFENSKKTLELEKVNQERINKEQSDIIADMKSNVKSFMEYHLSRGDTLKTAIYYWDESGSPYKTMSPRNQRSSNLPSLIGAGGRSQRSSGIMVDGGSIQIKEGSAYDLHV